MSVTPPLFAKRQAGFTIVELLIVIVVIAILAAISVVAYTGIQNRANDSAVQSDLNNFAKMIQLAAADAGQYPAGGGIRTGGVTTGGNPTTLPGFNFSPSKNAYLTTSNNLFYCTGIETASGRAIFRIAARSKSGNSFQYESNGGLQNVGNISVANVGTSVCQGMSDPHTWSYGYYQSEDRWFSWTNG